MAIDNRTDFFLDFQKFGDLKAGARADSAEAAQAVAQQFEGLFVQQMLAAMRSAARVDESQHSSYMSFYNDMYDKQLAQTIAGQDQLGVARLIMKNTPSLDKTQNTAQETALVTEINRTRAPHASTLAGASTVPAMAKTMGAVEARPEPAVEQPPETGGVKLGRVVDDDFAEVTRIENAAKRWQKPENFVADILPQAREAAGELGVSPELLVAQAALETGWGRHTMKFDDGRSSYNLFGIKAGAGWQGSALHKNSLEFSDGALNNQLSRFRAYASPKQSMADYVDFIRSNPRYEPALAQSGDDSAYIHAIHQAGYATDPHYADKILGILNGDLLRNAVAELDTGETDYA